MKQTMKTIKSILLVFTAALILASCSDDPVLVPPTAGFTVSDTAPTQWDEVVIISTAIEADEITYTVTGGAFGPDVVTGPIQFLDAATYTITQTVTNVDGTDESSVEVVVSAPINTYNMDFYSDNDLTINGDAYWFSASQIRLNGEGVTAQETDNTVKVSPDMGIDPFHGTGTRNYTFNADGGPGTYIGEFTHYPATGTSFDAAWGFGLTSAGDGLEVTLVYEGATEADNVYDVTMSNTTIDGYYDGTFTQFLTTGIVSVKYRGKITPVE